MNKSIEIENDKTTSDANEGKPSFWRYIITTRSTNLYRGKNPETFYTTKRWKPINIIVWIIPVLLILCMIFPALISGPNFWEYRLDLFLLVMLLVPPILILDYKLTKFKRIGITWENQKKINGVDSNKGINIILLSLIPILFIFIFFSTFSFNWLRSQADGKRDVNLETFQIGEYTFEFNQGADPREISISSTYLEYGSARIDIESQGTPEPIEVTLNGHSFPEEAAFVSRSTNAFWKDTFFVQHQVAYILVTDMEDENTIVVKCGDIVKEYTVLKVYPVIDDTYKRASTILNDEKIALRGHSFGDSMGQVIEAEGEPHRVYQDTLNKNATTIIYKKQIFFGYESDVTYTFENDELYKITVAADAFLLSDHRSTEEKSNEVIAQLGVLGQPDVNEKIYYSEGYVTKWYDEQYYIFLFVYPSGFSFIVEPQSGESE